MDYLLARKRKAPSREKASHLSKPKPKPHMERMLQDLKDKWLQAKEAEKQANKRRLDIEQQILEFFPEPSEHEGTALREGVSVTWKLTRKVDEAQLMTEWNNLDQHTQQAFKWVPALDLKQFRALEKAAPERFQAAARYVTATPAKPSIQIKE